MTPELQSERLFLRRHSASRVTPNQIKWLNDPEVVRYSEQRHKKHTLESQHEYLNTFPSGSHIWLIEIGDVPIGTLTAHIDVPNKVADMGILIGDKRQWGKGYGTEAWGTVMRYLFGVAKMRKIEAGMMRGNQGMFNICLKNQMTIECERYDHFLLSGHPMGLLLMARHR